MEDCLLAALSRFSETFGYHSLERSCQTGDWTLSLVKFGETFEHYGTGRLVVALLCELWFMIAFIVLFASFVSLAVILLLAFEPGRSLAVPVRLNTQSSIVSFELLVSLMVILSNYSTLTMHYASA